jgi:hypothetical protein
MNPEELKETAEHALQKGEKEIGLTMAIVAVVLAIATLLSHRAHTEEILLQGKASDKWNQYQAKHIRAYEFAIAATQFYLMPNGKEVALRHFRKSVEEECGVPTEKGCKSPLLSKDDPILTQIAKEASSSTNKEEKSEAIAAQTSESESAEAHAAPAGEKQEKPAKESGGKDGAKKIQEQAFDLEHERDQLQHRANYYDAAELFLEVSIVLCSISLLADDKLYWKLSFASTVAGIAVTIAGVLLK